MSEKISTGRTAAGSTRLSVNLESSHIDWFLDCNFISTVVAVQSQLQEPFLCHKSVSERILCVKNVSLTETRE